MEEVADLDEYLSSQLGRQDQSLQPFHVLSADTAKLEVMI